MKKKYLKSAAITFAALLAACSVTACSGGTSKSKSSADNLYYDYGAGYDAVPAEAPAMYEAETAAAMAMDEAAAPYYEEDFSGDELWMPVNRSYDGEYGNSADTTSSSQSGNSADSSQPSSTPNVSRKLIRTVSLSVETTDFDKLLSSIQQSVTSQGGYIQQSDISGSSISYSPDRRRYAYLTVRIPSEKLDGFLSQMSQQSNITNRSENVQDITLQYTDMQSRKKSLTIEQERLWELLEKADTLEAVIALEERLSEIRYELECFESQLRTYDNQVDYSTVTIDISEVTVFTPTVPDSVAARIQKGFIRNLENVGQNITDIFVWFISHIPALVVLFAVIGAIILFVRLFTSLKAKDLKPKKISFRKRPKHSDAKAETKAADPSPEDEKKSE